MIVLDTEQEVLRKNEKMFELSYLETRLLMFMTDGDVWRYKDLGDLVNWKPRTAQVMVFRIREKTGIKIKTIREVGYRLIDKVYVK